MPFMGRESCRSSLWCAHRHKNEAVLSLSTGKVSREVQNFAEEHIVCFGRPISCKLRARRHHLDGRKLPTTLQNDVLGSQTQTPPFILIIFGACNFTIISPGSPVQTQTRQPGLPVSSLLLLCLPPFSRPGHQLLDSKHLSGSSVSLVERRE